MTIYFILGWVFASLYFIVAIINAVWRIEDCNYLFTGVYDEATTLSDYVIFTVLIASISLFVLVFWLPLIIGAVLYLSNQ